MDEALRLSPLGDRALTVTFGNEISETMHVTVQRAAHYLKNGLGKGLVDVVPAYCAITLYYDPMAISLAELKAWCERGAREGWTSTRGEVWRSNGRTVRIPVLYGGAFGPDLEDVARLHGLSPETVISRHSGGTYAVYMIGFTPGFPYLGGMDPTLSTPRHATPRTHVAAGSVGIAGKQTGIYPINSPGGWQIIGRTPLKLVDFQKSNPFLLKPGDCVAFQSISQADFDAIRAQIDAGAYEGVRAWT